MEDAVDRLNRAIDYAVLQTTSGSPDQRGALYARLACALTTQGRVNDPTAITQLPNFEAFCDTLPIIVTDEQGQKGLHEVWNSPDFIAPAIASLAILFERTIHPYGDSFLTLSISRRKDALYGYRLVGLEAQAFDYSATGAKTLRPMEQGDWMKVSIALAGASLAFMKDLSIMRFAPFYLALTACSEIPEGSVTVPPKGRTPFIRSKPGNQT